MTTLCWFLIHSATAATITVATAGSGDYAQIQDAIDAATSGDTLQLAAGEWNAPFDFSGKDLTIKGEGREETLLTELHAWLMLLGVSSQDSNSKVHLPP